CIQHVSYGILTCGGHSMWLPGYRGNPHAHRSVRGQLIEWVYANCSARRASARLPSRPTQPLAPTGSRGPVGAGWGIALVGVQKNADLYLRVSPTLPGARPSFLARTPTSPPLS